MDTDTKETLLTDCLSLRNHHTVIICDASAIKHTIEDCLINCLDMQEIKEKLGKMRGALEQMEHRAWKASASVDDLNKLINQMNSALSQGQLI